MSYLVPMVIDETPQGERAMDIKSRLLKDRIVMLDTDVNEHSSSIIVAQFLFLESQSNEDISFFINSAGGSVTAGLAIYDTMQFIKPDISTIVIGQACSMGSFLAQAGAVGKRKMLPYARHMIHQPSGGARGMASDIEISYNEIMHIKKTLTELYVKHNTKGKTYAEFEKDMDRDTFLSANQALAYGLIDQVITKR